MYTDNKSNFQYYYNELNIKPVGCLDLGYIYKGGTANFRASGLFYILYAPSNKLTNLEQYSSNGEYKYSPIKGTEPQCKITGISTYYTLTNNGNWNISFVVF